MSQSFTCPNCGAPLDYDGGDLTVRCPYCNNSVIVPDALRSGASGASPSASGVSAPQVGAGSPWIGSSLLSQAERMKEVVQLLRARNKIEAIRVYRETFNVGLAEAKEAIDKIEAGQPVLMPGTGPLGAARSGASVGGEAQTRAEISRLVREGKKIEAIKLYREVTRSGLKEAKDAVESFESGGPLTFTSPPVSYAAVTTSGTYSAGDKSAGSFVGTWFGLSFFFFWVAFTVGMLGLFGFPGLLRLAAPVMCPEGYKDAYGERVFNYYDPETNSSVDGGIILKCVDNEGQITVAHPFLTPALLFGAVWFIGIDLALVVTILRKTRPMGCIVTLGTAVAVIAGAYVLNSNIPGAANESIATFFIGRSGSGGEAPLPEGGGGETSGPTPTPAFAPRIASIGSGEEGQGAGFFDDTRVVAVDGQGNIYTADYDGGRVQVFDSAGSFVNMWKIPGQTNVTGLAADREGTLYVVFSGNIYHYEGATGTRLGRVKYDESFVYDVAVSPFGDVVAASNQAIVRFDREGQITLKIDKWPELVGAGSSASLSNLAVDGEGNIFIGDSSASIIYKLSAEGRFLDRIGVPGDGPGKLSGVYALAADGQGRLYVSDSDGIEVLDENGLPVALIEVESLVFDMVVSDEQELIAMDRNANKLFKFKLP